MVEAEDAVRANQAKNQHMLARSYRIWSSYSKEAHLQNELQLYHVQLRNILNRVPAYLANGFSQHSRSPQLRLEHKGLNSSNSELFISGRSTWRTANSDCDLENKIIPDQLLLGVQRSTPCYFANDSRFANWPGLQGERGSVIGGNHLAIVAFAYAYILSACWVEMQQSDDATHVSVQKHDGIFYLDAQAKWICGCNEKLLDELVVDLGDVDDDAARWWASILATGEGWRAEIIRDGSVYRSPWSICIAATQTFRLRRTASRQNMREAIFIPPSSEVALRYLSDFSIFHGIDSQCSAALAATLTFPFLGNRTVTLPLPNPVSITMPSTQSSIVASHQKKGIISEQSKLLPYYMTLSCNRRGMQALLCGSFFDPQVSCNLVSPWFQPILEIIDPLVRVGDYEKLAIIMGKRQPKLAALWMGATISGMANVIFQQVRIGLMAIELNASAWTATTHSFISLKPEGLCENDDTEISRSDECRLLYLTEAEGHSRLPISPWKPFGTTMLCDTDIDVRRHAKCTGHSLQYISWSWDLYDGTVSEDQGFIVDERNKDTSAAAVEIVLLDLQKDRFLKSEMLSEVATRSIFSWLRSSGWPKREKDFYCHSWIELEGSDEELEDIDSDDGDLQKSTAQQAVEGWLEQQHATGWYSEASFDIDEI
jgi:hypothetical protein